MAWFKQLYLSWIILSVVADCVSCQELTSTLREGNHTCPGDEVIFTCTIRGSSSLSVIAVAWSSTEYIGQGGSLQLSTANTVGHVERSTGMDGSITATATLTNNTNVNGELILESTLRIIAVEASTVTCRDPNRGPASIEFTVSAVPGVPLDINAREISRPVENICIILVQWAPPTNNDASDIGRYIIFVLSRDIRNIVSSSSTISTLTVPNCGNDVRIQVAAVNRVGCVGRNSSEVQLILLDIPAVPTEDGSATTEGGSTSISSQLSVGAVVGITIAVILPTLCFLGLVFVGIFSVCVAAYKPTEKPAEAQEMILQELSKIHQEKFQNYLVDFYVAFKKDFTKENKLSSVESLSQMMENRTLLSKRYIKEAVKGALKTIKVEHGENVKKVLIYLKINVPKVLPSFDNELKDKDTDITMDSLIRAAEQNEHARVFDELMEIMDSTKPEIVEGLLQTMFEELQTHLQYTCKASSVEMKWLPGRTDFPGEVFLSGLDDVVDFPT